MTDTTVQVNRVYIKATPEAVWEAITQPDWTEKYLYGSRVNFDLRPGGAFEGRLPGEGGELLADGEVLEVDPPRKLVQTWRAIFTGEGATRLTWEIEETEGGVVQLTVTHDVDGAPGTAALVAGKVENAGGGWNMVLSGLKTLLETGKPLWG